MVVIRVMGIIAVFHSENYLLYFHEYVDKV